MRDDLRPQQRSKQSAPRLATVLHSKQIVHRLLGLHPSLLGIGLQQHLAAVEPLQRKGNLPIPHRQHFGKCFGAIGMAGVARHKDEVAGSDILARPRQEMLHLDRLAVFVSPEKADVEAMPRVFKVVGIAAEKGDITFGSKDESNVGVATEAVEMEATAPEQGDDVTP